jgi:formylmethanofuran dehydrogenase subunit D
MENSIMSVKKIIDSMPADVRTDVETQAAAAGKSLESYIEDTMSVQLTDNELDDVSGGTGNRIVVGANFSKLSE